MESLLYYYQDYLISQWLTIQESIISSVHANPVHYLIEFICILTIFILMFLPSTPVESTTRLTPKEEDQLIAEWEPDPLISVPLNAEQTERVEYSPILESACERVVTINGSKCLNFGSFDFLGIANHPEIKENSRVTIEKYGVGSCGPRGFYGTIDVHLDLEEALAKFIGTTESCIYSDGLGTLSSVIAAFSKKGDLIFCDESVNYHIRHGLILSRSEVRFFKHNDMTSLEELMIERKNEDKRKRSKLNRRFIVVEGIYQHYGDLSPLNEIVRLKSKYRYRLILDDSFAIGVLGKTGRGSPEHWGIPISDIDIYAATLDSSFANCIGFCTGSHHIVYHQRLSSLGYCFSASCPPYECVACMKSIDLLTRDYTVLDRLRDRASKMRKALASLSPRYVIEGDTIVPVIHIRLAEPFEHQKEIQFYHSLYKILLEDYHVAIGVSLPILFQNFKIRPSIRVNVAADHTYQQIDDGAKKICDVLLNAPNIL